MREAPIRKPTTGEVDLALFNMTLAIDLARAGYMFEDDRGAGAGRSWDEELEGVPWTGGMPDSEWPPYASD